MQKETVTLLVNYNKAANEAMDSIIITLNREEWEKPLGGFFPSVRSLCSHIYIGDFNWLKRFKNIRQGTHILGGGPQPFEYLNNPFFNKDYSFNETLFDNMDEYLAKRPDLDSRMIAFAEELTAADLGGVLKYTDSHGKVYERNFGGCVLHFLNHETHHRGMISLYLEMLGRENDFNSLTQVL